MSESDGSTSKRRVTRRTESAGLLQTLASIQFGIVLLIAIVFVAIVGTLVPQGQPLPFYEEHFAPPLGFLISIFRFDITFRSPLFIGLLLLFSVNLVLCSLRRFPAILRTTFLPETSPGSGALVLMPVSRTVRGGDASRIAGAFSRRGLRLRPVGENSWYGERWRWGHLGSSIVHLSLLVFILGGMVSLITSQRGYIVLERGQSVSGFTLADDSVVPLGFDIALESFEVTFYEDYPGRPKSYVSTVTITEPGADAEAAVIRVNKPLLRNGLTVFQSSYGITGGNAASTADTARVQVGLAGAPAEMPPIVTLDMVPGDVRQVPGFGDSIAVALRELYWDFSQIPLEDGSPNPAVRIDVMVHNEPRWSVYAFQKFPGMNMPMSEDLPLMFTMEGIRGPGEVSQEYYTVLGVTHDRGIPLMWTAAALMMIGLACSFYLRPKRVWMAVVDGDVAIGARTKGDSTALSSWIDTVINDAAQTAE